MSLVFIKLEDGIGQPLVILTAICSSTIKVVRQARAMLAAANSEWRHTHARLLLTSSGGAAHSRWVR